jgi:predicted metalloprotease with PDZ domain
VGLAGGRELAVQAHFDAANDGSFALDEDAAAFVERVEYAQNARWVSVQRVEQAWQIPCHSGCEVRYRLALREACEQLRAADTAIASGEVLIAPPSTWLLHPGSSVKNAEFELHVDAGPGARFVTALPPVAGQRDTYHAPLAVLDDAAYAAFGPLQVSEVPAGDSTVQLGVAPDGLMLTTEQAQAWVASSAGALASFYEGHLPSRHPLILLMKGGGDDTRGLTLGGGGPAVLIRASDSVTAQKTREDWVVTHELIHVNFPDLGRDHAWLSEGLATYIEPIARARVGLVTETKLWRDMVDGMPKGLPQAGDRGLENTHTWGRTYWGGALFCLLADVTLRERTGNRSSLDDVLLAIGKSGATDADFWPLSQVLDTAERATGTPVLRELYDRFAQQPGSIDLDRLFARLGVRAQGASVVFDDAAPLAAIRHAIAARRPG